MSDVPSMSADGDWALQLLDGAPEYNTGFQERSLT